MSIKEKSGGLVAEFRKFVARGNVMDLAVGVIIGITLSLALVGSLGLIGVWLAMAAELCARGLIFMVRLYRGKWLHIDLFAQKAKGAKNS